MEVHVESIPVRPSGGPVSQLYEDIEAWQRVPQWGNSLFEKGNHHRFETCVQRFIMGILLFQNLLVPISVLYSSRVVSQF